MTKPKQEDRRIRRTKRALSEALTAILIDGDYEKATIQDITDRADLNRATFYLHYGGKEELLVEMLTGRFNDLMEQVVKDDWKNPTLHPKSDLVMTYKHVAENADLYHALFKEPKVNYVMQRIIDYIAMVTRQDIVEQATNDPSPVMLDIASRSMAGSLFSLLGWWLDNDMPFPPHEMATITADICGFGVYKLMGIEVDATITS